jgi:hypothetical protein
MQPVTAASPYEGDGNLTSLGRVRQIEDALPSPSDQLRLHAEDTCQLAYAASAAIQYLHLEQLVML